MDQHDWDAWRSQFPGLQERTYLNTVSLGQLSNRSRAAVNRFLDLWTEFGASAWYTYWLKEVDRLRSEFALFSQTVTGRGKHHPAFSRQGQCRAGGF